MTELERVSEELKNSMPPGVWEQAMALFRADMDEVEHEARTRFEKGDRVEPTAGQVLPKGQDDDNPTVYRHQRVKLYI